MKIHVLSDYDTVELINARELKRLLADGKVLAFHRHDGWVKIGTDPVRGDGGEEYDGPERRNVVQRSVPVEEDKIIHEFPPTDTDNR